jgi:hypothetical protein
MFFLVRVSVAWLEQYKNWMLIVDADGNNQ